MDNPKVCDMRRYNDKGELTCIRCGQVLRGGKNPICGQQQEPPQAPQMAPEAKKKEFRRISRPCNCGGHKTATAADIAKALGK